MSDFGELCPIFNTGVYNELYLGTFTTSIYYNSITAVTASGNNFLSCPGLAAANPSSFRFGRTIVVTNWWGRKKVANNNSVSVVLILGRRTASGTAAASAFGSLTLCVGITAFPDIVNAWQQGQMTVSMTLNTADCLNIANNVGEDDGPTVDIIIQYREK